MKQYKGCVNLMYINIIWLQIESNLSFQFLLFYSWVCCFLRNREEIRDDIHIQKNRGKIL